MGNVRGQQFELFYFYFYYSKFITSCVKYRAEALMNCISQKIFFYLSFEVCFTLWVQSIFKPGYFFLNTLETDVCDHFVLIGQLLAVCDVSTGSGISGKEGDLFCLCGKVTEFKLKLCILSASPLEARSAHVWWSIKITQLLLFNHQSGLPLQLAFSNELIRMGCRLLPLMSLVKESH